MNNKRQTILGDYRIIRIGNTFKVQSYTRRRYVFRQWKTLRTCRDIKKAKTEVLRFKELDKEYSK